MTVPEPPAHLRGNVSYESIKPFVVSCLSEVAPSQVLTLSVIESLTRYLDCTYFILRHLHDLFKTTKYQQKPPQFYTISLALLELVLPSNQKLTEMLGVTPTPKSDLARHTRPSYLRHYLTQVWMHFLDNQLSDTQILDAMRRLGDGQLNKLQDARLLADHVMPIFDPVPEKSFHAGGMHALRTETAHIPPSWSRGVARTVLGLLQKGGLDYPRVYIRLYSLLDDSLLLCPQADRFLDDLDVYLSSLHLAGSIVAAFVKRLAQLAVKSPLRLTAALLLLVHKSLRRHPKCRRLIHRRSTDRLDQDKGNQKRRGQDPYFWDPTAVDFEKANALESSLWEVTAFQHHYSPSVAGLARAICQLNPIASASATVSDATLPSEMVQREDEALEKADGIVHKALLLLAESNCQMPELSPLQGWR